MNGLFKKLALLAVLVVGGWFLIKASPTAPSSPAAPSSSTAKVLRLATADGSKGTPAGDAIELWAKLIQEKSKGALKVSVYFQGELGGQKEVFDKFVMGDIDLMLSWPMTNYDKRISVLYTPFMVLNWEDALKAYAPGGWLNKVVGRLFGDLGVKYFGPWPEGFNGISTRGQHATTIEGARGIKVRTATVFPCAIVVSALGYSTVDIAWGELYVALQTGVVDGDGSNIIFWDYQYLRDVVEYYVHTKHQFMTASLVANQASYDRLSERHQAIVSESAKVVIKKQFKDGRALDLSYREKAIKHGIKYIPLNNDEHAAAITAVRAAVWPKMQEVVGIELMDLIRKHATKP
jgi:TRAP-type transport system periplasmic protein